LQNKHALPPGPKRLPFLGNVLQFRHDQLKYLDCVIKESMRIYPSAWTQGRQAIAEFDLDGYHFPAGTILMFSQWALHRLPDIWGDPEVYRPERWDPATGQKAPHWA